MGLTMWKISKLTTRLSWGAYTVLNKYGMCTYIMDDFGNMVPANGRSYLIG